LAAGVYKTFFAPYISLAIVKTLFLILSFSSYNTLKFDSSLSNTSFTILANSNPPSPPLAHTSLKATFTPNFAQKSLINCISSSVSDTNLLMATTTGTLYFCIFSICFSKLTIPLANASTLGVFKSSFLTPP